MKWEFGSTQLLILLIGILPGFVNLAFSSHRAIRDAENYNNAIASKDPARIDPLLPEGHHYDPETGKIYPADKRYGPYRPGEKLVS